ncbi:uncharacterized protein LOC116800396 [Drosophila sechellia]|uniref:uncharacterized protein LOC116800396 n=1 Tax=Drosophila sechellia TaxID=7238 RepID=UPI0013DDCBD4|nr:uncharacterized protein LOC116800396 [Drosophila sechellia]
MFRRFINLPLKRLWVGHQPSPYIQPWPLVKSNGSAFSHHQTTFFQDDPPMSYDILTNDLSQTGSSPSIRRVPQKVCIVGEVHSLKVCGCKHPGSCIFISQMGRLYHKESGRGKRESRPDVCQRARRFRERSNGKINKRLRDLMNDGVDGLDKGIEKNERISQMKRSSKKKYSPSSSYRSYPDDKEAYLEFQKPKRTFRNFVTMLMSKGRKVRQQLQEGKDADLLRYHSDNKALMKHYKNKIKYKRQITQRQLKAKPQVPKAKYNDDSIDWTFFENSLNPQKQDAFFPFKTKPKSTGRAKDKEISSHNKPILPHSLEVIKEREEKLISKAKKETEGRLPCLRESSFKLGNLQNVTSSSAEQKVDSKRVNENIMESSSNNSSGQKTESGLKIIPPDNQKPTGFYDTLKSRIPCDNNSEKKDCKTGLKPPNTAECISKMTCPRSNAAKVDNQPRSCQSDNSLHKAFKNQTSNNLWCSPEKDIDKGDIKSKKEGDFSKFFSMLDDKDKLKFRVAELMARCMFLVEKRMQQDLDGSKVCNVEEKDNNVNQLVENFWRHYIQCCECQKMDVCARSKSSMLGNTEKGIINKVDIIIKQCTNIKEVIEARSLKNQCIKHGLSQSIVEEFCKAKAKLENMSANEKLKTESNEFGLNQNCAIESLNDKCQERNNFVEDVLTKMSSECKTSDKYEQDLLSKMKLVIKELQKMLAEDKLNISKKHNQNNLFSENKLNDLNKCAEEDLKSKCAEEELKEKCAKEELKEKCAEEELREMCAIEELKEKCAEKKLKEKCAKENLKEKCAKEELKKACAEEELKRKCAEYELKEKCVEQELKEKCALKEFRELCAEEELKQKCAEKDLKDKCSDENLKERCSLKDQQRQCEEFSLRKRCAEFTLKKKCENNNGGNFLNLLGEPKKYSDEYKNSKKISTDEKPNKNSTEKDQHRSTLGKLKEKVGLTGKNNGNVNKFLSTKANKWHQSFGRRKLSVKEDIQNWGLIKKILDKEDKAVRNKGLQHVKPSELEGLGIFLRSALSRPMRRPQRGLEDENCTDDRKRFFNPRQWSLFPGLAPLYYQTLRRSPLLENNFLVRQLLPNLKPLAINDYLGVFWLHPLNSCNPFGKRCYKRDDFSMGSSFLYPFTEMGRRNFKDGVVKNN